MLKKPDVTLIMAPSSSSVNYILIDNYFTYKDWSFLYAAIHLHYKTVYNYVLKLK